MTPDLPHSLPELEQAISSDALASPGPASALAFLALARRALGDVFESPELVISEEAFCHALPAVPDAALATAFGDAALYRRCRASLLRHCKLAGLWASADPFPLLNQAARDLGTPTVNRRVLETYLPGLALSEITRERALAADQPLRGSERRALRASFAALDRLRDQPRLRALSLLGDEMIGPLPRYVDGVKLRLPLPPDLEAAVPRLPRGHAKRARRAYELALELGVLALQPQGRKVLTEHAARDYHAKVSTRVSENWASLTLGALIALLRAADTGVVPEGLTLARVRHPDRPCGPTKPERVSLSKTDRSLPPLPCQVEADVAGFGVARQAATKKITTLRRILARLFDGVEADDRDQVLQGAISRLEALYPEATPGTLTTYRSLLRDFLRHVGHRDPWDALLDQARTAAIAGLDIRGLRLLRRQAQALDPQLSPAGIDTKLATNLVATARTHGDGSRLRQGLSSLDLLRGLLPDLLPTPPIGSLPDGRKGGNCELPPALEQALRREAKAAGYSDPAAKAQLVAVRKLYTLSSAKERFDAELAEIPWAALTDAALVAHPADLAPYRTELTRLADRLTRNLSPGWRDLERAITDAGVARLDNPIAALARVAGEARLEPWQLDREWAWSHERGLRPDLRLTWARNITRLDALRELPAVAASGLLPPQCLGPMPARGARCRHGLFPLPRRFEAALDGAPQQLLEAAHLLWRCLRALGLFPRGADPAPGLLVSETLLERVEAEQSLLAPTSARQHLARLRDWRESLPGMDLASPA
ncbi:hypothetical protein PVT71_28630 (plasmid) [Salipiger sp. H15]|uniref:Core-binding (CB) domain-containing protein n=1 Tax=Alloyangia sp. H15 TaxID=3029062 RepID=A0AAU8AT29_9RHOB